MSDSTPTRPSVFIERIMPVTLLNQQVYYEHGGNPFKGLHRWYSRKPLSFSRASVLGSLLPADVSMEEFEYLLGLERRIPPAPLSIPPAPLSKGGAEGGGIFGQDTTTKLYKTPPSPERIKRVHDLCEQTWGTRTPTVLDAFAGGGSIPFEAVRYGLNVLASDLNPVAVVTMKAAMEYPLKFGPDLQHEIDKWVKWVGDEAEKRLAEFFPSQEGETVQNYLWAHTVVCPSCESVVPLSPNWWLSKTSNYAGKGQARKVTSDWYAVKPIPNPAEKRVDFELVKGRKGKGTTIQTPDGDFDPSDFNTISRGVGKCPNCENIIENDVIYEQGRSGKLGHSIYAIAYRKGQGSLEFRLPNEADLQAVQKTKEHLGKLFQDNQFIVPQVEIPYGHQFAERSSLIQQGIDRWDKAFNSRQLLTLVTYVEILNEVKEKLSAQHETEQVNALLTYLSFVLERCVDRNSRLGHWHSSRAYAEIAMAQHLLNLNWNYPETAGNGELWQSCADAFISDYENLCKQIGRNSPNRLNLKSNPLVAQSSRLPTSPETSIQEGKPEACATRLGDGEIRKRKRKNLPHWEMDGAVYAISFSTQDRIELSPEARQVVLNACQFFDGKRYQNYAIAIMPDHVHWLVQPLPKEDGSYWSLSSITHSVKSFTAHEVPKVMPHLGKLWQLESYDRIVRDERECLDTWEYIRQNPVKAGLSESPEAYPFFWQMEEESSVVAQSSRLPTPPEISYQESKPEACATKLKENPVKQASCLQTLGTSEDCQSKPEACATITMASADSLLHIPDKSLDAVVTDPPYYATIQYSELSDFFYVWQKRVLGDIFPELYFSELTDKDREAVANPSRFRNMGESAEELANRDYEAKMALAFAEYFRVLRDDGVMTVQFNHKDSGAWDVLAKSLIDAGFEITASWAISTENPQNLHQAQKNSVSSTVLLVCRKRDPDAGSAWWDDLRPELANLVEQRAPEFEANDITGIDLYLSAFGPALNVFSRAWPVLDSSGEEMRPDVAFGEARKAIANYRFRKLLQSDTAGFDPLTQWYILAWDAFRAREFPFDEARQLALAVGGFNVSDLAKTHKLLDSASGTCKLLAPQQRLKKRAFSTNPDEFSVRYLVDGLHAITGLYLEEGIDPVRRFMKATGLVSNDMFMRAIEVALKVIPRIGDERKRIPEEKALADL